MTVTTNSQPIVGAYGDIYTADVGTAPPNIEDWADLDLPGAANTTGWTKLGMVSEDGATWTPPEEETTDIKIWQSKYPARVVTTGLTSSLGFALDAWDRDTVTFALGGGTFTDVGTDTVIYHPPGPGESVSKAIFLKVLDGSVKLGVYFPKGRVTGRDDTTFKPDEAALLNVTFSLEGSTDYEPFQLVFDQATFPDAPTTPPPPATGATAGEPGAFTPSGAAPPANLTALRASSIVASPLTKWAEDAYVVLGDASNAYWDSDSWETGVAPA